jgi:hypothetical protein
MMYYNYWVIMESIVDSKDKLHFYEYLEVDLLH